MSLQKALRFHERLDVPQVVPRHGRHAAGLCRAGKLGAFGPSMASGFSTKNATPASAHDFAMGACERTDMVQSWYL